MEHTKISTIQKFPAIRYYATVAVATERAGYELYSALVHQFEQGQFRKLKDSESSRFQKLLVFMFAFCSCIKSMELKCYTWPYESKG